MKTDNKIIFDTDFNISKDERIKQLEELVEIYKQAYSNNLLYENIPAACRFCSNHPSNGGTGICSCILGQYNVTC